MTEAQLTIVVALLWAQFGVSGVLFAAVEGHQREWLSRAAAWSLWPLFLAAVAATAWRLS